MRPTIDPVSLCSVVRKIIGSVQHGLASSCQMKCTSLEITLFFKAAEVTDKKIEGDLMTMGPNCERQMLALGGLVEIPASKLFAFHKYYTP